jgi:hypothetical protein
LVHADDLAFSDDMAFYGVEQRLGVKADRQIEDRIKREDLEMVGVRFIG